MIELVAVTNAAFMASIFFINLAFIPAFLRDILPCLSSFNKHTLLASLNPGKFMNS